MSTLDELKLIGGLLLLLLIWPLSLYMNFSLNFGELGRVKEKSQNL
jgi:hypothetical protein